MSEFMGKKCEILKREDEMNLVIVRQKLVIPGNLIFVFQPGKTTVRGKAEVRPSFWCWVWQPSMLKKDDSKLDELGRCCRRLIAAKLGSTGGYLTIICPDVISLACHGEEEAAEDCPAALYDVLNLGVCVCLVCWQSNSGTQPPGLSGGALPEATRASSLLTHSRFLSLQSPLGF